MATLMAFIDPSERAAYHYWWDNATENENYKASEVKQWRGLFLIRRDKSVLSVKLPPKVVHRYHVAARTSELDIYRYYEQTFLKALKG